MKRVIVFFLAFYLISVNVYSQQTDNSRDKGKSSYTWEEVKKKCGVPVDLEAAIKDVPRHIAMFDEYKRQFRSQAADKVAIVGHNWRPLMSDIEDQGACQNCWCHAATGVVEGLIHDLHGSNVNIDLDEADIMNGLGRSCDDGGWPFESLSYIKTSGVSCENNLNAAPNFDFAYYSIIDTTYVYGVTAI